MDLNRLFSLVEGQSPSTIGFNNIFGMIGSAIGAFTGAISQNHINKVNARENQKDRDFQHQEAELSFQRQKELIDSQNKYNSFSNQRKLAEQAGLNPYRLFDQGSSGIATSSGSTDAPQASGVTGRSFQPVLSAQDIQASTSAALNVAQAGLMEKQGKEIESRIGLTDASTRQVQLQNIMQEFENDIFREFGRYEKILDISEKDARVAFTDAQTSLTKISERLSKYNLGNILPAQQRNIIVDTTLKSTQASLNEALAAKTDQDRQIAFGKYNAEIQLIFATIAREQATAYNQRMQGRQSGIMGDLYLPGQPGYNLMSNNAASASWQSHINKYKYLSDRDIYNGLMSEYISTMSQRYGYEWHKFHRRNGDNFGHGLLDAADSYLPLVSGFNPSISGNPF